METSLTLCTSKVCPHRLMARCKRHTEAPDGKRHSVDFTWYIRQICDDGIPNWYWCMMMVPKEAKDHHRRADDK